VGGAEKKERRGDEGEGNVRPPNENPAYATAAICNRAPLEWPHSHNENSDQGVAECRRQAFRDARRGQPLSSPRRPVTRAHRNSGGDDQCVD